MNEFAWRMKVQFHIRGLNISAGSRHWLEQSLEKLESLVLITGAAVVLERQRDTAPAFRAYVSLAVAGPDIHAQARDHTLQAVWLKVTKALRKQIERRQSRHPQAKLEKGQTGNGEVRAVRRGFVPPFDGGRKCH